MNAILSRPNRKSERPLGHQASGYQPRSSSGFRHASVPPLLLALVACLALTGCFGFLKPAKATARKFVLTPAPAPAGTTDPKGGPALGIGPVKIPAYLFDTSFAVRQGPNEVGYLALVLWAERLDTGLQRVLAANLSTLLPTDRIRLSAWRSDDVSAEIQVTVGQFDVDDAGRGALMAWWRILSPGGERTLKSGETRLMREGPAPETDPAGAVATLNELVAEFSRQLAQTVRETAAASGGGRF